MELNIYSGQRVLYKNGKSGWQVGTLVHDGAYLLETGLSFDVYGPDGITKERVTLENLFLNARKLEPWEKNLKNGVLFTKEDFIDAIENDEVTAADGTGYMSDGDYIYYTIPHLNITWIKKQPFDYVVWIN